MSGSNFGSVAGNIGTLVGAAGDIYSALNPPKAAGGGNKPFTGTLSTPQYLMGGGQLRQTNNDFLGGQRRIHIFTISDHNYCYFG